MFLAEGNIQKKVGWCEFLKGKQPGGVGCGCLDDVWMFGVVFACLFFLRSSGDL